MTHRPDTPERTWSVNELADDAGVTTRTIHYYIAQGLLPATGGGGRGTRYTQGHRDRLQLIRELQREHLPLAEIRQRLELLTDVQVANLRASIARTGPTETAYDYVQSVLAGKNRGTLPAPPVAMSVAAPASPVRRTASAAKRAAESPDAYARRIAEGPAVFPPASTSPAVMGAMAPPPAPVPSAATVSGPGQPDATTTDHVERNAEPDRPGPGRSQWERIALAPDIELHVRRPLSRIQNRAVERLVGLARTLLEEEQP